MNQEDRKLPQRRGAAEHRGSLSASHPQTTGSILGISKNYSFHVAEIY